MLYNNGKGGAVFYSTLVKHNLYNDIDSGSSLIPPPPQYDFLLDNSGELLLDNSGEPLLVK